MALTLVVVLPPAALAPVMESVNWSVPEPPLMTSPACAVVPVPFWATTTPEKVSLPDTLFVPAEPTSEELSAPVVSDLSKQFEKSFQNKHLRCKKSITTSAVYIPCVKPSLNTPNVVANTGPKLLIRIGIQIQCRVYCVCCHSRLNFIFSEAELAQVVA